MKTDKEGFLHREQAPKRIKLKKEAWRILRQAFPEIIYST